MFSSVELKETALRVYNTMKQPEYQDTFKRGIALAESICAHNTPSEEQLLAFAAEVTQILRNEIGVELWEANEQALPEFLSELNNLLVEEVTSNHNLH